MNGDHNQKPNPNSDDVFSSLSTNEPLEDAGYGPVRGVPRPHKPKHLGRNLLIAVGAIVVATGLLAGGMALAKHHKTPAKTTTTTTTASTTTTTSNANTQSTGTAAANSNTYTSNESALSLTLSYPDGWTVAPATTAPAGNSNITVTSPSATFTDASGASVSGKAVVTIRPNSAGISELSSGTATAAQNSVQIGYTNPSAGQHKYPYISFIHLASGQKVNGAFEEVMITGITQFNAGSAITSTDLAAVDPVISVAFYRCNGNTCTTPLSITNATWANNTTAVEALNVLESLQLK